MSPLLYHEAMRGLPRWLGRAVTAAGATGAVAILVASRAHVADPIFWLAALPGAGAAFLSTLAMARWRLDTEVGPELLTVRLHPLRKREIPLADIASGEPRTYRPFADYLGWGWRIGPAGRALTVPGRKGVQLVLRSGERLLISSAHPEELVEAIRSASRGTSQQIPS